MTTKEQKKLKDIKEFGDDAKYLSSRMFNDRLTREDINQRYHGRLCARLCYDISLAFDESRWTSIHHMTEKLEEHYKMLTADGEIENTDALKALELTEKMLPLLGVQVGVPKDMEKPRTGKHGFPMAT